MVSGAKTEITIGRQFKQDRIDIQLLKSRLRQQSSPGARIPPRFGTGPSGAIIDPIQRLATQGDSMMGPIAYFPQAVLVAAGVIDIGIQTSDYSSRIIVLGQGGAADDLDTILNARFAGQFLVLQAVATTPITLKHLTGNIRIPSGNDYIIKALESVILFFDSTTNEWILVAGDSGLTNPMAANLDMAGFSILNIGGTPAGTTGGLRLSNAGFMSLRNFANDGDMIFGNTVADAFNMSMPLSPSTPQAFVLLLVATHNADPDQILTITQLAGATGIASISTPDKMELEIAGADILTYDANVITFFKNMLPTGDGTESIGSVNNRILDVWASRLILDLNVDISLSTAGIVFNADGVGDSITTRVENTQKFQITVGNNEFAGLTSFLAQVDFSEITIPLAPGPDKVRLYGKLDGGFTKLFYRQEDGTEVGPLGAGGGAVDIISEGDSSVEVIDAGTGVVDFKLDAIVRWRYTGDQLLPATGRDGLNDIGSNLLRPRIIYSDIFDIQDDLASSPPASGRTQLEADQGGMNLGVAAASDAYDFFFGGVTFFQILEDGELNWKSSGKQHKIIPQGFSFDFVSENQADEINLITGGGRTNKTLEIGDTESVFLTENDQVNQYRLIIRQEHNTPLAGRAIGNLIWSAENTSSINHDYAIQEAESAGITGGSEQGRWRIGVTVNGSIGVVGMELIGVSTALRMGFFGVTPVVKQNPAVNASAIHAALQALGFFV